jgi:NitT/TauT family transport system ATP-binding protein
MPAAGLRKTHPNGISLVGDNFPRASTPPSAVLLEATRVAKVYGREGPDSVRALDEITVTLADGEFVSVVGPSGCGKSTLMKLIAGLYPPSGGTINYRGEAVKKPQRGMGIVFQTPVLLPWLTIIENVLLPIRVLKMNKAIATERALNLLDMVGLSGFQSKYPSELSGGMQQRAAIVRSLIHDPSLLLMDEPFGALDALTRERMTVELQRIWLMNKKTIFFITHSILESVFLSDRVIVMSARPGRIIKEFTIPFARPRDFNLTTEAEFGAYVAEIRQLLGATNDG